MVSLILSKSDYSYLQDISSRFGLKKSEFLRILIQSLKVCEACTTHQGTSVEVGGYGYEFSPQLLQSFVSEIETLIDGYSKSIRVTPVKTKIKGRKCPKQAFQDVS
jgi:predicted KAP-like P-loop ATPase